MRYFRQKNQKEYKHNTVSTEQIVQYCHQILNRKAKQEDLYPHRYNDPDDEEPWEEITKDEYIRENKKNRSETNE